MTTPDTGALNAPILSAPPSRWICVLLGVAMLIGGLLVLGDVMLFTVISALFIGWMAIIVGAFEVIYAFDPKAGAAFCFRCCSACCTSRSAWYW